MRIAYVCADSGVPVFGTKGSTVHVQEIIRAFRARGCHVELYAKRVDSDPPADLRDVPLHGIDETPTGFDLVYERYSLWHVGKADILEVNSPLIEEQATYRTLTDPAKANQVARQVFTNAKVIIAVSSGVADYLATFPETRGKVHVIPNGVNPARFDPLPAPTAPSDQFTIGFLGRPKPWHGLPVLQEACARLANVRLLVVGDPPVSADAVPGLLASMDVAVAPYPELKNFYFSPLKLYEYMAAGRAIVASRIGQIPDVIEDGVTGLLVPPGDVAALAAALDRLRSDTGLRSRLGIAAKRKALCDHTWDSVARRILDLAATEAIA